MHRYLRQLGTFLAPASVEAADNALRQLARWMITEAGLAAVGDIGRDDIEDFKVWLAIRPRAGPGDDHRGDAPAAARVSWGCPMRSLGCGPGCRASPTR